MQLVRFQWLISFPPQLLLQYFRPMSGRLTCGRKMKTCMKFICCRYCSTSQGCKIYESDLNARQGLSDCTALDEIFFCLPFLKYGTATIVSLSKMWKEVHKEWQIASEQSISLHIPEGGYEKRLTGNVAFMLQTICFYSNLSISHVWKMIPVLLEVKKNICIKCRMITSLN